MADAFINGPAAVLYGFTYFLAINEGGTAPVGLAAAVIIVLWIVASMRHLTNAQNLVGFFLAGYAATLALFLGWYL